MKINILHMLKKLKNEKKISIKIIFYLTSYIIRVGWDGTKSYI